MRRRAPVLGAAVGLLVLAAAASTCDAGGPTADQFMAAQDYLQKQRELEQQKIHELALRMTLEEEEKQRGREKGPAEEMGGGGPDDVNEAREEADERANKNAGTVAKAKAEDQAAQQAADEVKAEKRAKDAEADRKALGNVAKAAAAKAGLSPEEVLQQAASDEGDEAAAAAEAKARAGAGAGGGGGSLEQLREERRARDSAAADERTVARDMQAEGAVRRAGEEARARGASHAAVLAAQGAAQREAESERALSDPTSRSLHAGPFTGGEYAKVAPGDCSRPVATWTDAVSVFCTGRKRDGTPASSP